MAEIGSAFLSIAPSMKGFSSAVSSEAQTAGGVAGRTFGKMFALGASVIAAAGIGKLLKGSIEEAREANKVSATTEAVIKATGGAAKLTAKQFGDLATSISNKTGIDDEQIQSGENLLATFKNVKREGSGLNDIFGRATQAGVDLAATGFGSIEGNAKMLGKALNDPTKGITALTRAGVTFTENQKEQIKGFVESGDLLSAQKIILGEVEHQVGGVAEATATSTDKAKVAFGNLKEDLGQRLIPIVDKLADVFVGLAPKIGPAIGKVGDLFGRLRDFLAPFISQVVGFFRGEGGSAIKDFASDVTRSFTTNVLPILRRVGDFVQANFRPALSAIADVFRAQVLPALNQASDTFRNVILPAVTAVVEYVIRAVLPIFKQWAGIIITRVVPIVASLAQFLYGTLYPAVIGIVTAIAKNLKPVFDQLVKTFQDSVLPAIDKLLAAFQEAQPTIEKIVLVVVKVIGAVLKFAAAVLAKVLPVLIRFVGFILEKAVPVLIAIVKGVAKVVGAMISFGKGIGRGVSAVNDFAAKVQDKIGQVVGIIGGLPGKIRQLASKFKEAGAAVIGRLLDGLSQVGGFAGNFASNVWSVIKGMLNSAIDKINSALEFTINPPGPGPTLHVNPPNIPHLAKGGIVTDPTLALIGEAGPEMVVPLSGRGGVVEELRALRGEVRALADRTGAAVGAEINGSWRTGRRLARA